MGKPIRDALCALARSVLRPRTPVYTDAELGLFARHETGAWTCWVTRSEMPILVTLVGAARERPDEELLALARYVLSEPRFTDLCLQAVAYVNLQCPSDLCSDANELRIDQLYIDDKASFSLLFKFPRGANYRIHVEFRDEAPVDVSPGD